VNSILNSYLRIVKISGLKMRLTNVVATEKENGQRHLRINATKPHQMALIPH